MELEKKENIKIIGKICGFLFMYFIFTTVLYFVLRISKKIGNFNYLHIMGIVLVIILVGWLIEKWLK